MPSYETLFISADASVTGAQGYVYWRPGDPIYEDRDMILLEDKLAQDETCAHLVRNILLCVCCYCYSALLWFHLTFIILLFIVEKWAGLQRLSP